MTKVKICGLMEKEHVEVAVQAGADAIGFVFAPSKRKITIDKARELAKGIPPEVWKIGVFVNATKEELLTAFQEVPLDFIQYHGQETPEFVRTNNVPSIKALSVHNEADVLQAKQYDTDFYLFDAPGTDYQGGSGEVFDWKLMEGNDIQTEKIILAGGLNPNNVKVAIEQIKPFMVDVSSGVERNGTKDIKLIQAFIRAVKDDGSVE
ncbi:phosphoribosylanthranilate isomerase [Psychrobacillus psychrotolerans]|uniref:N-(5'-phosphoribosyl)anthranilate isomerase n=1 Tax=Psychrobacillus psychrotolerans TaxID=126156 RepID=A0A1I5VAG2_9BACI|nr:phosphoribosylanthranilate isomerase [Psychrobacillus psychrotolerans]SFQ04485.1 phosphoribosylanthranilate isomerase [Psychrobacillus psychrotolerans]